MKNFYLLISFAFIGTLLSAQTVLLDPVIHPKFQNAVPIPSKINVSGTTTTMQLGQTSQWLGLMSPTKKGQLKTNVWGYGKNPGQISFPSPTLVANANSVSYVEWINNLPTTHLLPVDLTYHKARPLKGIPAVTHLHGGHSEAASDGDPDAWFTQEYAEKGIGWVKKIYQYDNSQQGATLWYHDHALGMTRLNVYAGLAGFYFVNDANDNALSLPRNDYDRELVVTDRMFDSNGQLYFPSAPPTPTSPAISGMPEFFGDFILVNGMVWPFMDVEPRKYRFRLLNGSDSRFYVFSLSNNASFLQIATDDGKLNNPKQLNKLTLAPGQRAEIIVDFATMKGQNITVLNTGPDAPYGNPASPISNPATTGQIMQFRVNLSINNKIADVNITTATNLRPLLGPIKALGTPQKTRKLALFEGTDDLGRILPMLGIFDPTNVNDGSLTWVDPTTEFVNLNDTEVWEIYNTTADAHPVHLHLVSFQVLSKQKFNYTLKPKTQILHNGNTGVGAKLGTVALQGQPTTYPLGQDGWKDTEILLPGEVMTITAKFDRVGEYVWHCHILSHEDHDMMRKLVVKSASALPLTSAIILSMEASAEYKRARIDWASNNAYKNDYFVIQRLNDKTGEFDDLQIVNNLDLSSNTHLHTPDITSIKNYSGYDNNPLEGDNFYRIKVVFNDGTISYSEIKKVAFGQVQPALLFPNPTDYELTIDLRSFKGNPTSIYLYNSVGQLIQSKDFHHVTEDYLRIDVSEVIVGEYMIRIASKGKRDTFKPFIVSH